MVSRMHCCAGSSDPEKGDKASLSLSVSAVVDGFAADGFDNVSVESDGMKRKLESMSR
jgi:hypothetical protein